jgi:hypothetical protein
MGNTEVTRYGCARETALRRGAIGLRYSSGSDGQRHAASFSIISIRHLAWLLSAAISTSPTPTPLSDIRILTVRPRLPLQAASPSTPVRVCRMNTVAALSPGNMEAGIDANLTATKLCSCRSRTVIRMAKRAMSTGFLDSDKARRRPVGVAFDKSGALLIADDVGNTVWRVTAQ